MRYLPNGKGTFALLQTMIAYLSLVWLFLGQGIASAGTKTVKNASEQTETAFLQNKINKSPNDRSVYQVIRLKNQMTVLLISDEKANKSLMAASLPVGSIEDPVQQQGLAHYLEHMVLMGSKQYPEANGLIKFLAQNGGHNNAFTSAERTSYYVQVNNNAFDEAVARLADALSAPLLSEHYSKKEINAVNAEMIRAKSNDHQLVYSVNLATANPSHPATKFTVGNHETLSDKPDSNLQKALEQFYQTYYSANLFNAVLYSNQSIEQLAKLAEKTLGKMENKNVMIPQIDEPLYREQDKGIVLQYKPLMSNKALAISFDFPNDETQFKHKSGVYLSYLFSNNAEGTLSDYLIKQGLSDTGIQAYATPRSGRNRSSFSIITVLTEKGLQQQDQVISLIFQQIEKIKKEGVQQRYFDEIKQNLQREFQHLQIEKTPYFVTALAEKMALFPLENLIDEGFIAESMDEQAIRAKLDAMTLDNSRILLINDNVVTDKKTPYMEAGYSWYKITAEQKNKWLNFSANPEIHLPELNPYITTDFSVIKNDKPYEKPQLIEQRAGTKIYAMPSQYFPQDPKVELSLVFSVLPKNDELEHIFGTYALGYMNELAQSKLAFQSTIAGMQAYIHPNNNSLSIELSGYTQHLPELARDTLLKFKQFELTEKDLVQAKQRMHEALKQAEKEDSLTQANEIFSDFESYPYFDVEKQKGAIDKITLEQVDKIRTRLLSQATGMHLLSVGNFSDKQVQTLAGELGKLVNYKDNEFSRGSYVDISGIRAKWNKIIKVPNEDNALSILFIAQGYEETDGLIRATLLNDIISRWYFDDLRTEHQLGYVVSTTNNQIGKLSGIQFMVQSPNSTPAQIMQHNQRFLTQAADKLKALPDAEFNSYRESLLEKLRRKPESLEQEFGRYQYDFGRGNEKFDHNQILLDGVEKLTKQDIVDFYQRTMIEQEGVVFISQALGTKTTDHDAAEPAGFEKIESIEALQKRFPIKQW